MQQQETFRRAPWSSSPGPRAAIGRAVARDARSRRRDGMVCGQNDIGAHVGRRGRKESCRRRQGAAAWWPTFPEAGGPYTLFDAVLRTFGDVQVLVTLPAWVCESRPFFS